ncbi:ketoacyl-synt-domain-containing protein [Pholiota conissans]|uniref:Ketoacyl-synt-domain-containing protein n=1 Tax=Pholiota conissans TaxID=109636 RepID=A0A9P5YSG8_9AGAR|nr:ketoacyl-synt-domain-containing protein [Pholiota conissans]
MASSLYNKNTLLNAFVSIARSGDIDRTAVECGKDCWTYGDLDVVSTGLALDIYKKYGAKPTVAIVSENHPYVLAMLLATWKLGGIVAPMDHNVPKDIMERMLSNIGPTCVLVPSTERVVQSIFQGLSLACHAFEPKETTITALMQKYIDQSPELPGQFPSPSSADIALYLHTSSASSVANVKCVPISHQSILVGANSRLSWWKRTWPEQEFANLRVLGWSPWSHIIGLSSDIGAAMLLTAGTYTFAIVPSSYKGEASEPNNASRYLDICGQLLETAIAKQPTAFAGVPWVLEGFMRTYKQETNAARKQDIEDAIKKLKVFGSGGAATNGECLQWAEQMKIPLVLDIGMTELGGPLFHSTINGVEGWSKENCLLSDARLHLIDESGAEAKSEGELVVRSHFVTKGYLQYDNSAFIHENDGTISFRTGDIYGYVGDQRLVWKGRKEDYIQMSSGESLDPRVIEAILNQCPAVVRSCVIGNNFLKTSSQLVCAIIQPVKNASTLEITRAISTANRGLAPPLRISWSRVLILKDGEEIPLTKKGAIFRKKLEELFGKQLASLLSQQDKGAATHGDSKPAASANRAQGKTRDQIAAIVSNIVLQILRISEETMDENSQATFAELGMDSAMSTLIVNKLNRELDMSLPLNTCHTYIDLVSLTNAILSDLGMDETASKARPTTWTAPPVREKEEIVIVGQAVRLPGDIDTTESFWKALIDKREDIITPVPASRWDHASFYRAPDSTEPPAPCDITLEKAGFVDSYSFDHAFFGISSAEAFHVSPNIRLSMEIAFEALENANIPPSKVKGSNMAVFVAACMDEGYIKLLFADKGWGAYTRFYGTGVATSTACGRLSYLLDIHGPSLTIDTACSSGLIAFDQAVQYLQSGEGESAIVCGANTHAWPGTLGFLSAQKMTSKNSRCATFTNMADGYVPSEAATGLILKTKSAALRDGDRIIGVVRSTDVKHDGRSQGLVAPNVKAQIAMQIALLEKASLSPAEIDFIEAHGTGTSLGDLIEIQGINEVFESSHSPDKPLVVGAAKSCVGHAELVAGLIGVVKTLCTFSEGSVPGLVQLTADNMNPNLDCSVVPLHIPVDPVVLKTDNSLPLRGLILSNGFAGSIAGTILEAPTDDMKPVVSTNIPENIPMMFVVSGKSQGALMDYLNKYLDFCLNADPSLFHAICYTSCTGREHYRYRFACVVSNMQDLIARIEDRIQNTSSTSGGNARRILLGFPGQGSQYQGMGRYLSNQFSGFRNIMEYAAEKAALLTGYPILPFLVEESAPGKLTIDHSEVAPVCIFVFQYSVATWLESLGVHAHAVMGHSLGEIAAAVVARAFSFDIGLQFAVQRAKLLRADPTRPAGMVAIQATEDRVAQYIQKLGLGGRVSIAVYNASDAHVVSGELKAVEGLLAAAKRDGLRCTKLNVDQGFHSPSISLALPALKAWMDERQEAINGLQKPFFSTLRGAEIPKHTRLDSQYWVDHAQNAVRFVQTARAATKASTIDVIVDVGPQPTIWSNMQAPEFSGKSRLAITGKRGKDQIVAMLAALSSLFEKGFSIDFDVLFNQMAYKFPMTDIPTYPFQRLYNYPSYICTRSTTVASILNQVEAPQQQSNTPRFIVDQPLCDFLDLHRIEGRRVLPGAAMVDFFARAAGSKSVKSIKFHTPLVLETPETQVRVEIDEHGAYKLVQEDGKDTPICSGSTADQSGSSLGKKVVKEPEMVPLQMMSKAQIYECFKNVQFGEQFRTVQEVRIWADHADADIKLEATEHPAHDRIRKLDACLHMFGALSSRLAPPVDDSAGAYLPASLEDFTLHTDDMPYNFTCRYYLPLDIGRNARVLSSCFEVFSDAGVLLVSCKKYSVAWVPRGVVHKEQNPATPRANTWLRNGWKTQSLPAPKSTSLHKFDEVLYLGNVESSRVLRAVSPMAKDCTSVEISTLPCSESKESKLLEHMRGQDMLVVLDLSNANSSPGSETFTSLYLQILMFIKLIMSHKLHISSFLALSSWSAPVDLYKEGLDLFSDSNVSPSSLVGAILQGMIRVFRRETGLDFGAWCLDLANVSNLDDSTLQRILSNEIQARHQSAFFDTFVSYREDAAYKSLARLVPALESIQQVPARSPSGVAVIVGMGSIGSALAVSLIEAGCDCVVFLGRRPESEDKVLNELSALPEKVKNRCQYRQVDVCDKEQVKKAFASIKDMHGNINHVIHTAAVVSDSSIALTKFSDFEAVLRPKVLGSWNLHLVSQELNLDLESFVLCSSTNVIVGNPGQVAYVAANSFMDTLAAFRHNSGMPGISLQLGAWESKLISDVDMNNSFATLMKHDEGLPLILKAMMTPIPVQIIAHMDSAKLAATPAYAKDPFFAPLLASSGITASKSSKANLSTEHVRKTLVDILRVALELQPSEKLDMSEELTSLGADSITFAQFKGQVLKEFEVDVPMVYLSDGHTINDMINNVLESYAQASIPKLSAEQVRKVLVDSLRVALELQPGEKLDTAEELTSLGADSITFAQFKGQVLKEFEVDVPMIYLSDGYTISDMINHILESYGAA